MKKVTIWHNPRCSKSRAALELLQNSDVNIDIFKYLDETLTREDIKNILQMLGGVAPRSIMRTKEALYKELHLEDADDDTLIDAMVQHHKLIERPIVIGEKEAVMGRPIENVEAFLKH